MQGYKVNKIDKHTKKKPKIRIGMKRKKYTKQYIHNTVSNIAEKMEYTSVEATMMEIFINLVNNQDTVKRS